MIRQPDRDHQSVVLNPEWRRPVYRDFDFDRCRWLEREDPTLNSTWCENCPIPGTHYDNVPVLRGVSHNLGDEKRGSCRPWCAFRLLNIATSAQDASGAWVRRAQHSETVREVLNLKVLRSARASIARLR
jgi:hypothetical protein